MPQAAPLTLTELVESQQGMIEVSFGWVDKRHLLSPETHLSEEQLVVNRNLSKDEITLFLTTF
jgi:hypothetical protein